MTCGDCRHSFSRPLAGDAAWLGCTHALNDTTQAGPELRARYLNPNGRCMWTPSRWVGK